MSHQSADFIQQCVPYSHTKSRASAHTLVGSSPSIHRKVGNKITQTTNMLRFMSGLYNLLILATAVGSSRYKLVCSVRILCMSNAANHRCESDLPNSESMLMSFNYSIQLDPGSLFKIEYSSEYHSSFFLLLQLNIERGEYSLKIKEPKFQSKLTVKVRSSLKPKRFFCLLCSHCLPFQSRS